MSKSCDECGLCCKVMAVTALAKPAHKWCRQFRRATGCGIYEDRPSDCRVFSCVWLLSDDRLGPEWKPNVSGFILHSEHEHQLIVECEPSNPLAWRKEPYLSGLRRTADTGKEVLVFVGRRGVRLEPFGGETPVRRGEG